jgi:hypothetical protein
MESAFGTNFGGVRIHTDAEANKLNRELSALAFTTGSDIFFRDGQYSPDTSGGRELLAHELTHVVQQSGARVQTKLSVSEPGDQSEQEAERVGAAIARELEVNSKKIDRHPSGVQKKCACADTPGGACPVCRAERSAAGGISDLPASPDDEIVDIPPVTRIMRDGDGGDGGGGDGGGGGGDGGGGDGGGATPATIGCDVPLSMTKVTSGSFQGGLSMEKYYPGFAAEGLWQHGGSAGPFNTGSQVGSNVQLFGTVPSPCKPDQYHLAQTVTYTKAIFNGAHHPKEGVVQDDMAKSGGDYDHAPARQDFLGNGYNISMADPPGINFNGGSNIEFDRSFTTSLVGPGGQVSVSWSTSIKIENGTVTTNTVS